MDPETSRRPQSTKSIFLLSDADAYSRSHPPKVLKNHQPLDRIRSDNFPVHDYATEFTCGILMILYTAMFVGGANLPFPSSPERTLWITASIMMLVYTMVGDLALLWLDYCVFRNARNRLPNHEPIESGLSGLYRRRVYRLIVLVCGDRSKQGRKDRDGKASSDEGSCKPFPMSIMVPVQLFNVVYCVARCYVLLEDIIGLRALPTSAFETIGWFSYLPHVS